MTDPIAAIEALGIDQTVSFAESLIPQEFSDRETMEKILEGMGCEVRIDGQTVYVTRTGPAHTPSA
ncbi:hypothetical protein [Microvirga antarctica]|uniref:hypothetical protein n=1 Tax=Microvirga antarctica TaxID=2819233 RepID=UPI001B308760|nr:hypothetical protein [Microvirga antarctica]